jgi:hypothetical protein
MRGNKSYARRRNLLHSNQLDLFRIWVTLNPNRYIVHPLSSHEYEVLRIEEFSRSGNNPHMVFYRRNKPHDHITVPADAVPLVEEFIKRKRR